MATTNLLSVSVNLPLLHILYKWNHNMQPFVAGFLCFARDFGGPSMSQPVAELLSFLWLSNIPLDGCATFCFAILSRMSQV